MKNSLFLSAAVAALVVTSAAAQASDLRMSWWGGDSRHTATQEALKACGAKYGHTINPEFTGFKGHLEKLTTQIAGGTEADIMQVNWPWLPLFSPHGEGFADLNELSGTIKLDNWTKEQLESATVEGKLNGLPVSTTGRVYMFNKTTFEKAGIPVPTSFAELIAAGKVFEEKLGADYYPFQSSQENAVLLISQIATQLSGKDLVDPETGKVSWTKDQLVQAINFYQSLVDAHVVPSWKEAASDGNIMLHEDPRWANGEVGGSYEWDSTYFKYSDPLKASGGVLEPVKILKVDGAVTEGVYRKPSMLFSISKNSKNKEAAAQIVNCLMNEPEGITALGATRGLPASKAAATLLSEAGQVNPILLKANEIVMASEGPSMSPYNEHPQIRDIFKDTMEEFAYGAISADEAAERIIEDANDTLSELN